MKYIHWVKDNILLVLTLFLLLFIPLYPKKPLLDIVNTWVYVRLEDFVVLFVLIVWAYLLIKKRVTLKTPLTIPILLFWIVGAISTIHGILIIFPDMANVFPNVALLSYIRRIEYVSLFFIAYAAMRKAHFIKYIATVLVGTLLLVIFYGLGQKYFGFPAYLTMNEEFAKGIPIQLSALSRVPSTFGGHYDLAGYLVLLVPIVISLVFGVKNWFIKLVLVATGLLSFGLLFMTVSRVSFFAVIVALGIVLFFQNKKIILFSIPVIALVGLFFVQYTPALLQRFGSTVNEVEVLVDAETGASIGHPVLVPREEFKDVVILQELSTVPFKSWRLTLEEEQIATPSSSKVPLYKIPYTLLGPKVWLVTSDNESTGESLPEGTGYVNLSLSPNLYRISSYIYDDRSTQSGEEKHVRSIHGAYIIKKAAAYDLSFTIRYQGQWPNAFEAFKRNIILGSGYSSVDVAVDNNYLRILAETGLLGFVSYFALFITIGIYIKRRFHTIDSPFSRSFVIGFSAGVIGLMLNAVFIDVFEASKIAFYMWILAGVTLGLLEHYDKVSIDLLKEFKKVLTSSYAIVLYLFVASLVMYSSMLDNYFIGDDFTWLRWAAECTENKCSLLSYFTQSDGFFYRPGTKIYFFIMYNIFWLNPAIYHAVSIFLHFVTSVLVFLISRKILKKLSLATLSAFLFLILSGFSEALFWISASGFMFHAALTLASLYLFILWDESRKHILLSLSILLIIGGFFFHELGVVSPLLLLVYKFTQDKQSDKYAPLKPIHYILILSPIALYLAVRYFSNSYWFAGDYSYNLVKLPFNFAGNFLGYVTLALLGPVAILFNQSIRTLSRENLVASGAILAIIAVLLFVVYRLFAKKINNHDKKIILFSLMFSFVSLLPFLGLGNMTSRYSYLASVGIIILIVFIIDKLYIYLKSNGKYIALMSISVVVSVFALLHIIQVQEINGDWQSAGGKVKNFFASIDAIYQNYWTEEPMTIYFVNVPIRTGEAWIFPVGLSDGLWLTLRNPDIEVVQVATVKEALDRIDNPRSQKILIFTDSGKVIDNKKILGIRK